MKTDYREYPYSYREQNTCLRCAYAERIPDITHIVACKKADVCAAIWCVCDLFELKESFK